MHIPLKTSIDVLHIKKTCRIVEEVLFYLKNFIISGITTREIDRIAGEYIAKQGAVSSLKGYKDFPGHICTSVNNVAAHGIPDDNTLEEGDIITIDVALNMDGWHGDGAWTYSVGKCGNDIHHLIKTAWQSLLSGILNISAGNRFGNVGYAVNKTAVKNGCSVFRDFVGHGIGQNLHEEPAVPHYGKKGQGMVIKPGMVFTVEPMVTRGGTKTRTAGNGWSIITEDASLVAQFEHTVAVYKERIEILTFSDHNLRECLDQPPFF